MTPLPGLALGNKLDRPLQLTVLSPSRACTREMLLFHSWTRDKPLGRPV